MKATYELITILDYMRYATSRFNEARLYFGHGTENAWDEAAALIFHCLFLPHDLPSSVLNARLTVKERNHIEKLIAARIKKRIPLPYLTHEAWFLKLPFYVDERVLIPRSPIAELIEQGFQPWMDPDKIHDILDLCTGSGCIAVACAKTFADVNVDASDLSEDALAVAEKNIIRHEVQGKVHLFKSNLFASLPLKKYDIIISNPPYVDSEDMDNLPSEFKYEPKLALAGGENGLKLITEILRTAKKYLKPHGILIVEVGNSEAALTEKFPNLPFTWLEFQRGGGGVFLLHKKDLP